MPTGYTSGLYEGEEKFEEFALKCARAIGTMMHMRDELMDSPIRYRKEDMYYKQRVENSEKDLEKLKAMTNDEIQEYGLKVKEDETNRLQEELNRIVLVENRYNDMLAKVQAWNPASDFAKMKEFMIEQLKISIGSDCSDTLKNMYINGLQTIGDKKPRALWEDAVALAQRDYDYYKQMLDNDSANIDGSNQWIDKLFDELGLDKSDIKS